MNRSLDELTANELNQAIDDTNFPKAFGFGSADESSAQQQNGKPNSPHATSSLNGNEENANEHAVDGQNSNEPLPPNVQNGIKGFIKRAHPAPLKMVAFNGDSIDVPGTPRTPRTSTTPGNIPNNSTNLTLYGSFESFFCYVRRDTQAMPCHSAFDFFRSFFFFCSSLNKNQRAKHATFCDGMEFDIFHRSIQVYIGLKALFNLKASHCR